MSSYIILLLVTLQDGVTGTEVEDFGSFLRDIGVFIVIFIGRTFDSGDDSLTSSNTEILSFPVEYSLDLLLE